jgi:hypothetical protein
MSNGLYYSLAREEFPGSGEARRAWNSTLPARTRPMSRTPWISQAPLLSASAARLREETVKSAATGRAGSGSGKLTPPAPSEFTPKVKLLVRKRAGRGDEFQALCEGCTRWLGRDAGEFQHRLARGRGGCRDAIVNGPANCLLLCRACHMEAEERRRDLSQDGAGFWIEHGNGPDYDPRLTAVMLGALGSSGVPVYLAADGLGPDGTGYLLQAPEVAA